MKKALLLLLLLACSRDDTKTDSRSGGFTITVSGEDLAQTGYAFASGASVDDDPPPFVDGWEVKFTHVIVTIDHVRLNEDPDRDPADPMSVGGEVARVEGPVAVDVTIGGTIPGKSGSPDERTVQIATIDSQSDGSDFDPTARYAFSYDTVPASASARNVNLDADGLALYEQAKAKGWAMVYAGVATYRGEPSTDPALASLPTTVKFTLGMANPSSYVNCQNTDLAQLSTGEFPRGLQADPTRAVTAQITIHTDHGFWSKLNVEGTELHFDPIAAQASADGIVTLDDLVHADVTGFKTRTGTQLPWRSLVSGYTPRAGQLYFDANGTTLIPYNSFADYLQYSAASGGHLNADGECEVRNNFTF